MSIDPLSPLRGGNGLVRLHGHRAARGVLPENTLFAFDQVFQTGVRVVELDILITRDGVPVITHNPRLDPATTRGADGAWIEAPGPRIIDLDLAELQAFDIGGIRAGTEYAAKFPEQAHMSGQSAPRFSDLCALIAQPGYDDIWLNIELKRDPGHPDDTPPTDAFVASVLADLRSHDLVGRVVLQCFDWSVLKEIAAQAPQIPRSCLSDGRVKDGTIFEGSPWMDGVSLAAHGGSLADAVASTGAAIWTPHYTDVTSQGVARAHELGLIVNTWTVNDPEDMKRVIAAGVDGIITDYPGRAQRLMLELGLTWTTDMAPDGTRIPA